MNIYGTDGDDNIEHLTSPGIEIWQSVYGGGGNDRLRVAYGNILGEAGNDTIIGARTYGVDLGSPPTASYTSSPAGVTVNLATGIAHDGYGTIDTLININSVKDSSHSDLLIGSAGADEFILSGGSDIVLGAGGSDVVMLNNIRSTEVTATYHIDTAIFTMAKATAAGDTATNTFADIEMVSFSGPYSDHSNITVTGGRAAGETYAGGKGEDVVYSGKGNDSIDAGEGRDIVIYSGDRAGYTITRTEAGLAVSGAQGNDTLVQVERVYFADKAVAFGSEELVGQAYRLYEAAFDRTPDLFGLGFWIAAMENGVSQLAVANEFVNSQEFRQMYSGLTNAELVDKLYKNILDRQGDLSGISHWTGVLDSHAATVAEVLAGFSQSGEFIAKLAGVIENGVEYLPYGGA
ncbi:MAG TPA: DUF4214 domain-containing protein [Telluria sp.]|nr:DUF4214 domain-containing protein [Telluria sp.]